jgi:hypothetical protein
MAANVDATGVPAVLGHPKGNDPAYAWAREVKRQGDSLLAKFADVNPEFSAGVESGAYRNRSISVVPLPGKGWTLRHVGWLGAAPPAISGLKPVEFTADGDAFEFSAEELWPQAWALGDIASAFRRLREWLIGKDGQDVADRVMPDYTITSLTEQAAALRQAAVADQAEDAAEGEAAPNPLFTQAGASSMSFTQADLDRAASEAAAKAKAEAEAAAAAQFAATTQELQRLQSERANERIGAAVHRLVGAGIVTPAEQAGLAEFMSAIDGVQAFEFSATGGAKESKSPAAWFADFMAARQPIVQLGKRLDVGAESDPVDANDAHAIAKAATEFQAAEAKAGRTISVDVAVANVLRKAG